jgi:ParB family chromosome partitioning protein
MEINTLKKSLGKGLDSLIRSNNINNKNDDQFKKINEVFLTDIIPNKSQPRKDFDLESLNDLAESIKEHGLIQPIVVRKIDNKLQIIAGERRWRACQIAGITKVPVSTIEVDNIKSSEIAIVENLQREDLNPIEIAKAIKELIDLHGLNEERLIKITGKKKSTIINSLRILNLPSKVISYIQKGKISRGHALALLAFSEESRLLEVAEEIISKKLTVRQVEKLGSNIKKLAKNKLTEPDIYIDNFKNIIEERLGLPTKISGSSKSGKVEIKYKSLDELNKIMDSLK